MEPELVQVNDQVHIATPEERAQIEIIRAGSTTDPA